MDRDHADSDRERELREDRALLRGFSETQREWYILAVRDLRREFREAIERAKREHRV